MITKLRTDSIDMSPHLKYVKSPTLYRSNTPVHFIEFLPGDMVRVELPIEYESKEIAVEAAHVDSGLNCPEESLPHLAEITGQKYDTLAKAAQSGRLLARRSGKVWLSTENAIEHAIVTGKITPRT